MIKVRVDQIVYNKHWAFELIGMQVFVEDYDKEFYRVAGTSKSLPKIGCTVLQSDTQHEPTLSEKITSPINEHKGFCIKRTPENAEVLNKWGNENGDQQELQDDNGYIHSNKDASEFIKTHYKSSPHQGFTELFTIEEFFAKVNYTPDSDSSKTEQGKIIVDTDQDVLDHIMKEDNYVSSVEEENAEQLQKIEYLDVAGAIAGFKFKPKDLDMIVSIYDLFIEFGGKLDLDTISKAKFEVEERHLPDKLEE